MIKKDASLALRYYNQHMKRENPIIALAVYRYEDWNKLLNISDDRESLEKTWEEWNDNIHKLEDNLSERNIQYCKVTVDLVEMENYCRESGGLINSESRSGYAAWKFAKLSDELSS